MSFLWRLFSPRLVIAFLASEEAVGILPSLEDIYSDCWIVG